MGMYTEVFFRAEVDRESAEVMELLAEDWDAPASRLPDHPFFATPRHGSVFSGGSAYFPGEAEFKVIRAEDDSFAKYGPDAENWAIVSFRTSLKDYGDEVAKFFDWVTPHVRDGGGGGNRDFIGYSLYEDAEQPVLYFGRKH